MNQTLDQQRAAYAWKVVQGCSKEYQNLAKGAGALIMSSGLMATLAYYEDKSKNSKGEYDPRKKHHKDLLNHILNWILDKNDFSVAMNTFHSFKSNDYRAATQEVLDLLRWIRQFASAVGE
jgi:CRISPR-associated protein Cmr5